MEKEIKELLVTQSNVKFDLSKEMKKIVVMDDFIQSKYGDNHGVVYYDDMKIEVGNKIIALGITQEELELAIKNNGKKTQKTLLLKVHSNKVKEIRSIIANKTFSRELEAEYDTKEKEAITAIKNNDFSYFELSAQLKGITSKQYAQLVVKVANEMHSKEKDALRKIGDIRSFISDLIDADKSFQAQKMLDYVNKMQPEVIISASNTQLMELIATYSN
jgi:hypothetical protein